MLNQLTEMTSYNIVTTDFPFLEKPSNTKKRPALVLTKSVGPYGLVIVAFITSNIDLCEPTDIIIEQGQNEFSRTGLTKTSLIQLHKLFTLPLSELHDNIGSLSPEKSNEVQQKLKILFNLTD